MYVFVICLCLFVQSGGQGDRRVRPTTQVCGSAAHETGARLPGEHCQPQHARDTTLIYVYMYALRGVHKWV